MPKPVTTQEMFDLWQKMVNPGGYPLQSLMFPVLDAKEIEKKIAELETVEHWLKANLNMLQLTIKSLEYQRAMIKGGERARETLQAAGAQEEASESAPPSPEDVPNPALWAWNMMAQAGKDVMEQVNKSSAEKAAAKKPKKSKKES